MTTLEYILLFTFIATILSLFLVSILLVHKTLVHRISFGLVAFGAGALLATAFLDTLKEALEMAGDQVLLWVTIAFAGFFLIERLFVFLHHHDEEEEKSLVKLPTSFLLFGDGMHNFIDGASIAASFLVSIELGIITSLAVFIHEIPHELGDFGILLSKGFSRGKVLGFNIVTGITALAGALLAYYLGQTFTNMVPVLLAITTGNFLYLSAVDLLPEIHHHARKNPGYSNVFFFLLGIALIAILVHFFEA